MDFLHIARLNKSRREISELQRQVTESLEVEVAERLRPALLTAMEALRTLHDDDVLWSAARNVIQEVPQRQLVDLRRHYANSLPALLDLFGYEVPPPPPAQQLVTEVVDLIESVGDGKALADELATARATLAEFLQRAKNLPRDPPWRLMHEATRVNSFLELGIQVAAGAAAGGVAAAFTTVLVGSLTGGIAPIAGFVVLGGVRLFRQANAIQHEAQRLATEFEQVTSSAFPAAALVVNQHLANLGALSDQSNVDHGHTHWLAIRRNLESVIEIAGRFVFTDGRVTTLVKQARLNKNYRPKEMRDWFGEVFRAAEVARSQASSDGTIHRETLSELSALQRRW